MIRLGRHEITSNHTSSKKGGEVRRIRKKERQKTSLKKDYDLPRLLDTLVELTSRSDPIYPIKR